MRWTPPPPSYGTACCLMVTDCMKSIRGLTGLAHQTASLIAQQISLPRCFRWCGRIGQLLCAADVVGMLQMMSWFWAHRCNPAAGPTRSQQGLAAQAGIFTWRCCAVGERVQEQRHSQPVCWGSWTYTSDCCCH